MRGSRASNSPECGGSCNLPEGFEADAAIKIENDFESIARGLRTLFTMSYSERRAIGQNGRDLVERHFTSTKLAEQMFEV